MGLSVSGAATKVSIVSVRRGSSGGGILSTKRICVAVLLMAVVTLAAAVPVVAKSGRGAWKPDVPKAIEFARDLEN